MLRKTFLAGFAAAGLLAGGASAAQAATLTVSGSTITYTAAADKANEIDVNDAGGGNIQISTDSDDPIVGAPGSCTENTAGQDYSCPGTTIVVNTGNLEDAVNTGNLATGQGATTNLGDGDDLLQTGPGDDTVDGGPGNDLLYDIEEGTDNYNGGAGDDNVVVPMGPDQVSGGSGIDSILYIAVDLTGSTPVDKSYTLDDQANDGAAGENQNIHSDVEDVRNYITDIREFGILGTGYYGNLFGPTTEGKATLVGSAAVNSLHGGEANDDLDGGPNNDILLGGEGDDILRSVDGYADRLACGPGADTANADTLDIVSDSCETVNRTDVGNANEDKPPTVTFDAPAAGTTLTTKSNILTATATDDRGVAQVLFLDDDRVVCTDTTAPYTCDYAPRGDDVGRNTLAVTAVDTSQQTATAVRTTTVPRFAAAITAKVSPKKDTTAPYTFTTSGKVKPPTAVSQALGCNGTVSVQIKAGKKTVSTRRAKVSKTCTYKSKVTFAIPSRLRPKSLKITARFLGNAVLLPKRAKAVKRAVQ